MRTPGYHGRYLRIDLSTRTWRYCDWPVGVLRQFLGGVGLGTWLLLSESRPRQDPLSAEAPVAIVFSPLVGSPLTTSAKFAVVSQSPLTDRINDSLSSSHFAIAGKKTGCDALLITGQSPVPVALRIQPDRVDFLDAAAWWGLSAQKTGDAFRSEQGSGFRVAAIGVAGENLVRYATVSHDGRHAGRGGTGAVWGAKRLKAIGVQGDRLTDYAQPRELMSYAKRLSQKSFGPETAKYRELGTVSNLLTFNRLGTLPTRNFQQGEFESAQSLALENHAADLPRTRTSCAACTIGCEHLFVPAGRQSGVRMEYESLFALGSLCGIADPQIALQAVSLCDEYGLDTISTGGSIAFAMECVERGWLDAPQLRFGAGEPLLETIAAIAHRREPIGALLAEGSRRAAAIIGQGSLAIAPQVKGMEIPGYEPRALQTMALGFAVGTRGADHNRSGAYQVDFSAAVDRMNPSPEAIELAIETENEAAVMDSLILCKFLRGVFDDRWQAMSEMLGLITGWDMTPAELKCTAERIVTARKWFNIRQGWTIDEDTLPDRFFASPLESGASAGAKLDRAQFQQWIEQYNRLRNWSPDGVPADADWSL